MISSERVGNTQLTHHWVSSDIWTTENQNKTGKNNIVTKQLRLRGFSQSISKGFTFPFGLVSSQTFLIFSCELLCFPSSAPATSIFVFPKPHPVSFWLVYSPPRSLYVSLAPRRTGENMKGLWTSYWGQGF